VLRAAVVAAVAATVIGMVCLMQRFVRWHTYQVARRHAGRFCKDTSKNEFSGVNIDTYAKYVHIVNMWFDFCLANWALGHVPSVRAPDDQRGVPLSILWGA
jgi:hypothetical protein